MSDVNGIELCLWYLLRRNVNGKGKNFYFWVYFLD